MRFQGKLHGRVRDRTTFHVAQDEHDAEIFRQRIFGLVAQRGARGGSTDRFRQLEHQPVLPFFAIPSTAYYRWRSIPQNVQLSFTVVPDTGACKNEQIVACCGFQRPVRKRAGRINPVE